MLRKKLARASAEAKIRRWEWTNGGLGRGANVAKNLARASAEAKISQVGMGNFGGPGRGAKVAKVLYL